MIDFNGMLFGVDSYWVPRLYYFIFGYLKTSSFKLHDSDRQGISLYNTVSYFIRLIAQRFDSGNIFIQIGYTFKFN